MKTAISIPDHIFQEAEQLAKRLGVSRSAFYVKAVSSYIDDHQNEGITEALNMVYGPEKASAKEEKGLDPEITGLQLKSLPKEVW